MATARASGTRTGLGRPQIVDLLDQAGGHGAVLVGQLLEVLVEEVTFEIVLNRAGHESARATVT